MVVLEEKDLIGKGNERLCYVHPEDKTKVIKVTYNENGRKQNELEYKYYQYLKKRKVSFDHIPQCYGWISLSDHKKGLVFDRVMNDDNSNAKSFAQLVKEQKISYENGWKILEILKRYLETNEILYVDIGFDNILCKEKAGVFIPYIVDGLGGRRVGWKFYLYQYLGFFRRYKIKKQWKKVEKNYKLLFSSKEP